MEDERRTAETMSNEALIDYTIEFWTRYSGRPMTREEAREAIRNIVGYIDTLARWDVELRMKNKEVEERREQT